MIVILSCPHCGKPATEYDQNKWSCLHCGRKFIYAPEVAPVTNNSVQTTVNVVGPSTYELDITGAKSAKPIYKTRGEVSPEMFTHILALPDTSSKLDEERSSNLTIRNIAIGTCMICVVATVVLVTNERWVLVCFAVLLALPGLQTAVDFGAHLADSDRKIENRNRARRAYEEEEAELAKRRNETVLAGHQPICPHCVHDVEVGDGLSHCLHCGKQFHYANNRSFPVRFR